MALIAAFAVSAYASSAHRAASKPFNPLLAETYECVRDDKGFRFIAEQVWVQLKAFLLTMRYFFSFNSSVDVFSACVS